MRNLDVLVRLELEEFLLPKFFYSPDFKKVNLDKFNETSMVDIYKHQAKGYGVELHLVERNFRVDHFIDTNMHIIKITLPPHDVALKEEVKVIYMACLMYGSRIILQQYFQVVKREGGEILQVKNFMAEGFDFIKLNRIRNEKEELKAVMEAFEGLGKIYTGTDLDILYESKRRGGECKIYKIGIQFQK